MRQWAEFEVVGEGDEGGAGGVEGGLSVGVWGG